MKEENVKKENLCGMNKEFETPADGMLYIEKRSWVPRFGGLRELIMNESDNIKYLILFKKREHLTRKMGIGREKQAWTDSQDMLRRNNPARVMPHPSQHYDVTKELELRRYRTGFKDSWGLITTTWLPTFMNFGRCRITGSIRQTSIAKSGNAMEGIDIDALTIEQYFMLTKGNQAPSMVKTSIRGIEEMTIAEYLEYKATMKRQCARSGFKEASYNSVYEESVAEKYQHYADDAKIDLYYELPPLLPCNSRGRRRSNESHALPNTPKELILGSFTLPCSIGSFNFFVMADPRASVNVMPKLMFEYLKLADLKKTDMLVEMADMTKNTPLSIVENVLVKIDKFLFSSDFVIIDMLKSNNVTMILGRPFLATIHAEIDESYKEVVYEMTNDGKPWEIETMKATDTKQHELLPQEKGYIGVNHFHNGKKIRAHIGLPVIALFIRCHVMEEWPIDRILKDYWIDKFNEEHGDMEGIDEDGGKAQEEM
ncbi:putative ribonuclease H-like domain-containing protein [Tanacetum coccineum]